MSPDRVASVRAQDCQATRCIYWAWSLWQVRRSVGKICSYCSPHRLILQRKPVGDSTERSRQLLTPAIRSSAHLRGDSRPILPKGTPLREFAFDGAQFVVHDM